MITRKEFEEARRRAAGMMRDAGIVVTDRELAGMDVADFGLGDLACEGGQMTTFIDTRRVAFKIIVLFPGQTLPEHWHSSNAMGDPGKEETIRTLWGRLRLYLPGESSGMEGVVPKNKQSCYTSRREVILTPGGQATIEPGVRHWFQAGADGAVVFSCSSFARDALDPFTDPDIVRVARIVE